MFFLSSTFFFYASMCRFAASRDIHLFLFFGGCFGDWRAFVAAEAYEVSVSPGPEAVFSLSGDLLPLTFPVRHRRAFFLRVRLVPDYGSTLSFVFSFFSFDGCFRPD